MFGESQILGVLRDRMQWHQQRQKLLAHNVSNADTPGFRPTDLRSFATVAGDRALGGTRAVALASTTAGHMQGISGGEGRFATRRTTGFETTPSGNSVSLETEMMKLSDNMGQYQLAASLYSKSLGYLKIAIGKKA